MIRKMLLITAIIGVSGCETINMKSQCDPEKNYIHSNPQLMDEYKKKQKNGEIKSIHYVVPNIPCLDNSCLVYEYQSFEFIEILWNGKEYTVNHKNIDKKNCLSIPLSRFYENGLQQKTMCFYAVENNSIKSEYEFKLNSIYDYTYISLKNIKTNDILYESKNQVYSTRTFGMGGSFCPLINNNENYKFDPITFKNKKI